MEIRFEVEATCREIYRIPVPRDDVALVKGMTAFELACYADKHTDQWNFCKTGETNIEGGAEDAEVVE